MFNFKDYWSRKWKTVYQVIVLTTIKYKLKTLLHTKKNNKNKNKNKIDRIKNDQHDKEKIKKIRK